MSTPDQPPGQPLGQPLGPDAETLSVYDRKASEYRDLTARSEIDPDLASFLGALPAGSDVLDLGCGPGAAAAVMAAAGHHVTATDAAPEMVKLAAQHPGVTARHASFDDIDAQDAYDAIWANFSLLHAPREDMPRHLTALRRALRPGGLLHIGMKTGSGSARDALGRLYTYYSEDELAGLLRDAGFTPFSARHGKDTGLDGTVAPWVTLAAHG